jgi:endonuclease YncB( thermonuclease family)
MKKLIIIILISIFCLLGFKIEKVSAMPVGTLLYRTSSDAKLYGLNQEELMTSEKGIMKHIYSGHSAIYVGKIDGKDYIVEALAGGLQKTEAKYFIDESQGEKFLGAKIPQSASNLQRQMAAEIALALSEYNFGYDFDFHNQKGPGDGKWTCVGLTEKVYESADINNPYDFSDLKYDNNYAVDITPDGYDNYSMYNNRGDVFSRSKEFSKINPYTNTIIPAPELLGFNMGRQYQGDRYFFFPYTQFLQDSLEDVELDIDISSNSSDDVRPRYKALPLVLKYTFINQPLSMIQKVTDYVKEQKAVAYSADNNDYEIGDSGSETNESDKQNNDSKNSTHELSPLLKENLGLSSKQGNNNLINYSNIIDEFNDLNNTYSQKNNNLDNHNFIDKLQEDFDYSVKEIISADTILLENDIQVTLASITLPQLKNKIWQTDECQAKEALSFVNRVLSDATVKLKYGDMMSFDSKSRLLAYVYFRDKSSGEYKLLNKELLYLGLANVLACNKSVYCDLNIYKDLEKSHQYARDNKIGIFSDECKVNDNNSANKLSNLGKNLFKGISLKTNQVINSLGKIINKPKKDSQSIDNLVNDSDNNESMDENNNSLTNNNTLDASSDNDTNINNDTNDNISDNTGDNYNACIDKLLISAIYSTKQDDWVELYNDCDKDIDLAKESIRLEKAVSIDNPSIIIRFDQADDYSANNTIIRAYDTYHISRAEAVLGFNVDAMSLRSSFSFGDSGYSLYLAKGPVLDIHDEDIIDLLGYGSSEYFRGTRPAPAIDDYYMLRRKANINSNILNLFPNHNYGLSGVYNSGHNFQDFILLDTGLAPVEDDNTNIDDSNNDSVDDNNGDEVVDDSNNVIEHNTCVDELLITAVYTTLQDDYIEIFNNCDQSIDLFAEGIRLEKAISREDPAIIIRFDELSDYIATSTVIAPYSSYTISREESVLDINFDAVSQRNDFSFTGDAYTIYLAKGPVSDLSDEDIIDVLGYGSANYYLGSGPATYIDDYMLLRRKANINSSASTLDVFHDYSVSGIYNTSNNFADYISISSGFNDSSEDETVGGGDENNDILNTPINLWHFDSCFGDYLYNELSADIIYNNWQWIVGNGSCALRADFSDEALEFPLVNNMDANNMSILWDYQFEDEMSRVQLELVTIEGANLILTINPYYLELTMPGQNKIRYDNLSLPLDTNWHRLAFTTDFTRSSLNIYLDGIVLSSFPLEQRLYDVSSFKLISDNSYLKIDEVAVFNKALDETDLSSLLSPMEPYQAPTFIGTLNLKHSWNFIEGQGNIAYDTINSHDLNMNESYWSLGISDFAIKLNRFSFDVVSDLLIDNIRKSFSLSFWYKNNSYPDEGRGRIMLKNGVDTKLGLTFTPFNSYIYYNNKEIPLSTYDVSIPYDDNWHYLALTYNASDYSLRFYIDGMEVHSDYKVWLSESFNYMEIIQENWEFILDEINIYEGALNSMSIYDTYQQKYY